MLSRIAENLYWIGRYVERAENTARLLDVNYHALLEAPLAPGARGIVTEQWAPLLAISGTEDDFRSVFERADAHTVPLWLAVHPRNPGSIRSSLQHARENARGLRDRITLEMWEAMNRAYLSLCGPPPSELQEDALHDYCSRARDASHEFFGIADATLPRDLGWSFIQAGRMLERADATLRTLMVRYRESRGQAPVADGIATHRGLALLQSLSAYESFRKRQQAALDPSRIVTFLLLDPDFPRSVRFSLTALQRHLDEIAAGNPDTSREPQRQAGQLASLLAYAADARVFTEDEDPGPEELLEAISALSEELSRTYFWRHAADEASLESTTEA